MLWNGQCTVMPLRPRLEGGGSRWTEVARPREPGGSTERGLMALCEPDPDEEDVSMASTLPRWSVSVIDVGEIYIFIIKNFD